MKDKTHLTLPKLIKATIMGELFGFLNKTVESCFPSAIGDYNLEKMFKKGEIKSKMFVFALYENKNGEKALAKMWRGKVKDLVYYTLLNEIAVYKTLNSVLTRLSNSIPPEFKGIRIPKYLDSIENKNSLLILTEYIKGKPANDFSNDKAFDIYIKCFDFLRYLGGRMTRKEKERISKRTAFGIIFLYPFFLIREIVIRPYLLGALIKGLPIVLNSLPVFLKKREISLVHKDLQPKNILISKNKNYLIDLQFCIFSYELYDFFTTLRTSASDKKFREKIGIEIGKRFSHEEDPNWTKGLMVICATHGLSGNNLSTKEVENNYIIFLKFAVRGRIEKGFGENILNKLPLSV